MGLRHRECADLRRAVPPGVRAHRGRLPDARQLARGRRASPARAERVACAEPAGQAGLSPLGRGCEPEPRCRSAGAVGEVDRRALRHVARRQRLACAPAGVPRPAGRSCRASGSRSVPSCEQDAGGRLDATGRSGRSASPCRSTPSGRSGRPRGRWRAGGRIGRDDDVRPATVGEFSVVMRARR